MFRCSEKTKEFVCDFVQQVFLLVCGHVFELAHFGLLLFLLVCGHVFEFFMFGRGYNVRVDGITKAPHRPEIIDISSYRLV